MTLFSERRLIYRRASDFADQSRYTSRVAEANAEAQEAQHAQQLLDNGVTSTSTPAGQQAMLDIQQQAQTPTPSVLTQAKVIGNTDNAVNYNTQTGQTTDLGFKDPSSGAMGKQGSTGINPQETGIVDVSKMQWTPASGMSQEAFEAQKASIEAQNTEKLKQESLKRESQRAQGQSMEQLEQPTIPTSPVQAGEGAAIANLPPEAQFLAPFLQQFQDSISQSLQENATLTESMMGSIEKTYGGVEAQLTEMQEGYRASTEAIQGLIEDAREQNNEYIAEQKKAEEDRLAWDEYKTRSTLTKQKREQRDAMVAQIALDGGFGQDAGLRAVMESDAIFDSRLSDLAVQFSMARTDLAAKFTGLYTENQNNYINATVDNMKELRGALERISMQGNQMTVARQNAEQSLLTAAWDKQVGLRSTLATQNLNVAGQIMDMITQEKRLKQQDEQAIERLRLQEEQADRRFGMQLADDQRQEINVIKKTEQSSADDIRSEKNKATAQPDVERYMEIRSAKNRMTILLDDAIRSGDPDKLGAAKVLALTLTAKVSDPTTGVRDGELEKFGKAQSWINKVKNADRAIRGGDLTGLSSEVITAYSEAVDLMYQSERQTAMAWMTPVLNQIITHNNRAEFYPINPSDILPQEFLTEAGVAYDSYYRSIEREEGNDTYNFDWGSESEPAGGGEVSNFGDALTSMGRVTQYYDTKIADKASGGLYEPSTVAAWGGIHAGLDVAVPQNSDFQSLIEGEVIDTSPNDGGWGGTIIIRDTNGAEHRVSHLSEINPSIRKGAYVNRGDIIAKTGGAKGTKGAGNSTGAHVDYRIRYNGKYVDPLTYNPYA